MQFHHCSPIFMEVSIFVFVFLFLFFVFIFCRFDLRCQTHVCFCFSLHCGFVKAWSSLNKLIFGHTPDPRLGLQPVGN